MEALENEPEFDDIGYLAIQSRKRYAIDVYPGPYIGL